MARYRITVIENRQYEIETEDPALAAFTTAEGDGPLPPFIRALEQSFELTGHVQRFEVARLMRDPSPWRPILIGPEPIRVPLDEIPLDLEDEPVNEEAPRVEQPRRPYMPGFFETTESVGEG